MLHEFQEQAEMPSRTETGLTINTHKLLNLTKSDIKALADQVIVRVSEGDFDSTQVMIANKKAMALHEAIDVLLKPIFYGKNIVSRGDVLKMHNVEIEPAGLGSVWLYDGCQCVVLERLNAEMVTLKEKIAARQLILKGLTTGTELCDEETGESYTAFPAVNKKSEGYKITINK